MSASHSILLLELEELKAEMSKCMARVEKVISSVRNVQPGEVSESLNASVVKDNIVNLVGSRFNTSSDDTDRKDDSFARVEGTNDNLDCISSRPSLMRKCSNCNRNKGDTSEDNKILDNNSNTVTEAKNKISIPTKIVEESITMTNEESGAIVGYGGIVVDAIRRETGVSIKVTKGRGSRMCLVELKGKQADVEPAMEMIKTILAPPMSHHASDWVPSDQLIAGGGLTSPIKIVKRTLTVPNRDAGTIIGERGENINFLREAGRVRIKVRNIMEGSSRKLVEIMGEETCVERALDLIKKKVMEENEKI